MDVDYVNTFAIINIFLYDSKIILNSFTVI